MARIEYWLAVSPAASYMALIKLRNLARRLPDREAVAGREIRRVGGFLSGVFCMAPIRYRCICTLVQAPPGGV